MRYGRKLASVSVALIFAGSAAFSDAADLDAAAREGIGAAEAGEYRAAYDSFRAAALAAWEEMPLQIGTAVLSAGPTRSYGGYQARDSNVYTAGETVRLYADVLGFDHRRTADGYEAMVAVDFFVKLPDGEVLGGRENMLRRHLVGTKRNTEFFLDLTYTLTGLPPGDYVVTTRVRDVVGNQQTEVDTAIVFR